jgi:hypothetical protein
MNFRSQKKNWGALAGFCFVTALEVSVSRLGKTNWADHLDRGEL